MWTALAIAGAATGVLYLADVSISTLLLPSFVLILLVFGPLRPPDRVATLLEKANAAMGAGDVHGAMDHYQKALRTNPTDWRIHIGIGRLHACQGSRTEAVESFRQAVEVGQVLPVTHFMLGTAYEALGDMAEARQAYTSAAAVIQSNLDIRPQDASLHESMAVCLNALGRWEDALQAVDEARRLGGIMVDTAGSEVEALCGLGRYREAAAVARQCFQMQPSARPGMIAWLCARLARDMAGAEQDLTAAESAEETDGLPMAVMAAYIRGEITEEGLLGAVTSREEVREARIVAAAVALTSGSVGRGNTLVDALRADTWPRESLGVTMLALARREMTPAGGDTPV